MGWTKRDFVKQAFEEIGYASYVFDLEPEQLQSAMRKLDTMMATWNSKGIKLYYPLPSGPATGDLDDETGVPDAANEAIYTNLALRLAPTVGKQVSQDTRVAAKMAYNELLRRASTPPEMKFPRTLPAGAGNKPWRDQDDPFLRQDDDNIVLPPDNDVEFFS